MTDTTLTDRDRVGDFIRRAVPRELAEKDIDWPHELGWDEAEIRITVTRGELTITRRLTFGGAPDLAWADADEGPWWTPVTKKWAQEAARRLVHQVWLAWIPVRHADSTGRLHVRVWRDPAGENRYFATDRPGTEEVRLVLEPEYVAERAHASAHAQVRRMFSGEAMWVAEALAAGVARVE